MEFQDILQELGSRMGLRGLCLDDNNVCRLVFDGRLTIDIEPLPERNRLFLHSVVCPLPAEDREGLFAELLEANLFGKATGGASFGLDANLEEILLFRELDLANLDYQGLASELEIFLQQLEIWTEKVRSGRVGEGDADGEDSEETDTFLRV
jgi:hypothetical protein